ncbi:MAG: BON domain-containing protein [Candidatus Aminicenantes bacterium]|jgi:osmotically-inducible protein OsmY
MASTDEQIKKMVVDQLLWDSRIDASHVKVEVTDGVVILTGTVPGHTGFRAAVDDTWVIPGVIRIDNRLNVQYPAGVSMPPDEKIKTKIEDIFLWNPSIDESKITVISDKRCIKLEGSVDSYWKKFNAEEIAYGVLGVVDVTNELAVVPSEDIVDEAIAEDLIAALDRNIYVNDDAIDVKVKNGKVTLSGIVDNTLALRIAVDTARHTLGVRDVTNNLTLS